MGWDRQRWSPNHQNTGIFCHDVPGPGHRQALMAWGQQPGPHQSQHRLSCTHTYVPGSDRAQAHGDVPRWGGGGPLQPLPTLPCCSVELWGLHGCYDNAGNSCRNPQEEDEKEEKGGGGRGGGISQPGHNQHPTSLQWDPTPSQPCSMFWGSGTPRGQWCFPHDTAEPPNRPMGS